jgi:AraC-like DNA-binding protein
MEHPYRERPPPASLRDVLACTWTRRPSAGLTDARIVPDACVDVVWREDGVLQIAGPDTAAVRVRTGGLRYVGARFVPGAAAVLLGWPASALRDLRVDLADLWGRGRAGHLADRLAAAPERAEQILVQEIQQELERASPPDPLVRTLVGRLGRGHLRVAAAAADLGLSERQLRRRCEAAVGYGPKTLDRILRFQRFRALARRTGAPLVELALAAGYADQAHLNREYMRLAGATPSSARVV